MDVADLKVVGHQSLHMCGICGNILMNAVELRCSHAFCQYCIEPWETNQRNNHRPFICPICRKNYSTEQAYRSTYLDRIISSELQVECKNTERGCRWTGTITEFQGHKQNCQPGKFGKNCARRTGKSESLEREYRNIYGPMNEINQFNSKLKLRQHPTNKESYFVRDTSVQCDFPEEFEEDAMLSSDYNTPEFIKPVKKSSYEDQKMNYGHQFQQQFKNVQQPRKQHLQNLQPVQQKKFLPQQNPKAPRQQYYQNLQQQKEQFLPQQNPKAPRQQYYQNLQQQKEQYIHKQNDQYRKQKAHPSVLTCTNYIDQSPFHSMGPFPKNNLHPFNTSN